jgi:hypothetical protein
MKRVFAAALAVGVQAAACCTPIDDCEARTDCAADERCDFENGFCSPECDADEDCSEIQRCDVEKGFCVFEEDG